MSFIKLIKGNLHFCSIKLIHFFIINPTSNYIHCGTEVGMWEGFIHGSVEHQILYPSPLRSLLHVVNL